MCNRLQYNLCVGLVASLLSPACAREQTQVPTLPKQSSLSESAAAESKAEAVTLTANKTQPKLVPEQPTTSSASGTPPSTLPGFLQTAPSLTLPRPPIGLESPVRTITNLHLAHWDEAEQALRNEPLASALGHGATYAWLAGELSYSDVRRAWRLRYAYSEEEDPHGGIVTLTGLSSDRKLRQGDRVMVTGYLEDPESSKPSPSYRVQSLQTLMDGKP